MDEGRLWGLLGVTIAAFGVLVIAPEVLHALGESGTGPTMLGAYGLGALVAALLTVAVIGPDLVGRASR
ncbi:MAG: hypothetical protein ABEJ61_09770 [Haloferacaceae archaeon]